MGEADVIDTTGARLPDFNSPFGLRLETWQTRFAFLKGSLVSF